MIPTPFSGILLYNKTSRKLQQEDEEFWIAPEDAVIRMQVDVVEVQAAGPPRKAVDKAFIDLEAAHPGQHCLMRYEALSSAFLPHEPPTTRILFAFAIGD